MTQLDDLTALDRAAALRAGRHVTAEYVSDVSDQVVLRIEAGGTFGLRRQGEESQ